MFSLVVTHAYGLPSLIADPTVVTVNDQALAGLIVANDSPTTLGASTTFTATVEGSNAIYAWSFGDDSSAVGNPVTHSYSRSGTYTTLVTVTNGSSSITAATQVTITNLPPIADAGPDQSVLVSSVVMLDGSASRDPDGHMPLSYGWQQVGGSPVVLSSDTVSRPAFSAPGTPAVLTFTLLVSDAYALVSYPDQVVVTLNDHGISGLQAINNSPTTLGHMTVMTASISAGTNIIYDWDFGDNSVGNGVQVAHMYDSARIYMAQVTATNSDGSITASTRVTVTNLAPIANAGLDQVAFVNAIVTLDGSASTDPDGHLPLVYRWQQIGGPTIDLSDGANARPAFTAPARPAVLTFTLQVTDAYGLSSLPDQVVIDAADQPIASLTLVNNGPTRVGLPVNFTAHSISGTNLMYLWNFGDDSTYGPTASAAVTHTYLQYGLFTAVVTVTNGSSVEVAHSDVVVQPYEVYLPLTLRNR